MSSFSQSRMAEMKNVLAEGRLTQWGGRYCPGTPSDHPNSPRPAMPVKLNNILTPISAKSANQKDITPTQKTY